MTEYHILDNGDTPYVVRCNEGMLTCVQPLKQGRDDEDNIVTLPEEHVLTRTYARLFDGATDDPDDLGSSILAQLHDGSYLYIGSTIYTFRSKSPIVAYHSPIGNSAVPYPYAVDDANRAYLMIEHTIVSVPTYADPYDDLYSIDRVEVQHNGTHHIQLCNYPGWMWDHMDAHNAIKRAFTRDEFIATTHREFAARNMEIMECTCTLCNKIVDSTHKECMRRDEPWLEPL